MALIDHVAAARLREQRELQGLSPEALSTAIHQHALCAPWGTRGAVDAHTIRRIERYGHVPGPRVQFVLANYFGTTVHEMWSPAHTRVAA